MKTKTEKIILSTPDRIKLVGVLTKVKEDNNKIVVLCHGITADKDEDGIFTNLASALAKIGVDSLRFDFRGHGEN